jgi:hypothetical protein
MTFTINGYRAKLVFKKFSETSDWICVVEPQIMELLEEAVDYDTEYRT